MQQQDSYSQFMPLRQSSLLTDETLLMNDTDVYANVTVIWPAGHRARELELERARIEFEALADGVPYVSMCDSLQETVGNTLASTMSNDSTQQNSNESHEDTIWMTALDIPFSPESNPNEESMFDTYHTVLDYTLTPNKENGHGIALNDDIGKMNLSMDQISLNDTLPMDEDEDVAFDDQNK